MNDLDAIYEKVYAYLAKKGKGMYFKSTMLGILQICDNHSRNICLILQKHGFLVHVPYKEIAVINNINEIANNINLPIASKKAVVDAMVDACRGFDLISYDSMDTLQEICIVKQGSTLESLAIEADLA